MRIARAGDIGYNSRKGRIIRISPDSLCDETALDDTSPRTSLEALITQYQRVAAVMSRINVIPPSVRTIIFFSDPLPPSTPTPVPRYALGHEPEAPVHALTGGACAPHAATAAERRRAALRFSDFRMALAPCSTQAAERRCA